MATIAQLAAPREARSSCGPFKTSLRWTSWELRKVAPLAQLAALREARSHLGLRKTPLRWTPYERTNVPTGARSAAPWKRGLTWACVGALRRTSQALRKVAAAAQLAAPSEARPHLDPRTV